MQTTPIPVRDFELKTFEFLSLVSNQISDEQKALLHTSNQILTDLNYLFCNIAPSLSDCDTTYKNFMFRFERYADEAKAEMYEVAVVAEAVLKDNHGDKSYRDLLDEMITKIKMDPIKYKDCFDYAQYLLNK